MKTLRLSSYCLLALLFFSACASKKDILYFQDVKANATEQIDLVPATIQVNDILNIRVSALNPETAIPFNMPVNTGGVAMNNATALSGYLVGPDGTISFPVLGNIKVQGLSIGQVETLLVSKLIEGNYIIDPTVYARVMNNKFTVLGEVRIPGTYTFGEQHLNLIQALGMAGDLSINGCRSNILIIREQNGERTYHYIDMTKTDWFKSPYYFIRTNDVIVVKPNGPKVKTAGHVTNIGTLTSLFSVALSIFLLLTR